MESVAGALTDSAGTIIFVALDGRVLVTRCADAGAGVELWLAGFCTAGSRCRGCLESGSTMAMALDFGCRVNVLWANQSTSFDGAMI